MVTKSRKRGKSVKLPVGYQGREFTTTLQANTAKELNSMIRSLKTYAHRYEMDDFQVLSKGKDPDGGYRAVVQAHNWNPLAWIKEKWEARGGGPEARARRAARAAETREAKEIAEARAAPALAKQKTRLQVERARAARPQIRTRGPTDFEYALYQTLITKHPDIYDSLWARGMTIQDLVASFRDSMPELYDEISREISSERLWGVKLR